MRAIDADSLLLSLDRLWLKMANSDIEYSSRKSSINTLYEIRKLVKEAPLIEPVKHGHWILDETINNPRYQIKTCSLCGCRVNGTQFNFCPSCGARMSDKVSGK